MGSNLPVIRDMCKLLLRALNAQGFGTVLCAKEDTKEELHECAPNLPCVCSCSFASQPLSFTLGEEVYLHKCGRVCRPGRGKLLGILLHHSQPYSLRKVSLNLQLILFGLDRKSESPSESGLYPSILGFPVTTEPLNPVQSQLVLRVLDLKLWSSYLCIKQSSLLSPPSNQARSKHKKREVGYKVIQIEHPQPEN